MDVKLYPARTKGRGGELMARNLARNMSWMLRCFALGRENGIDAPEAERTYQTNFVR